jgi:hypothetical protein
MCVSFIVLFGINSVFWEHLNISEQPPVHLPPQRFDAELDQRYMSVGYYSMRNWLVFTSDLIAGIYTVWLWYPELIRVQTDLDSFSDVGKYESTELISKNKIQVSFPDCYTFHYFIPQASKIQVYIVGYFTMLSVTWVYSVEW